MWEYKYEVKPEQNRHYKHTEVRHQVSLQWFALETHEKEKVREQERERDCVRVYLAWGGAEKDLSFDLIMTHELSIDSWLYKERPTDN